MRVVGLDHPLTLTCVNSLAIVVFSQGSLVTARMMFRRGKSIPGAFREFLRILGMDHPDTIEAAQCLAFIKKTKSIKTESESIHVPLSSADQICFWASLG